VEDLQTALDLFTRRRPGMLALRLPGSNDPPPLPGDWKGSGWIDLGPKLTPECVTVVRRALAVERPAAALKAAASAVPGQPFTDPLTGIRFLWIPGGRFQMGTSYRAEHWVRISPFWLGETPVTNRQYAVFLEKSDVDAVEEPSYWRDRRFSSPDQPVVGVSWEDAAEFCLWLSEASDCRIKLPSEAQW
jgi:formylglycine-generating enzyme required for sulfatase activity